MEIRKRAPIGANKRREVFLPCEMITGSTLVLMSRGRGGKPWQIMRWLWLSSWSWLWCQWSLSLWWWLQWWWKTWYNVILTTLPCSLYEDDFLQQGKINWYNFKPFFLIITLGKSTDRYLSWIPPAKESWKFEQGEGHPGPGGGGSAKETYYRRPYLHIVYDLGLSAHSVCANFGLSSEIQNSPCKICCKY